MTRLQTPSPTSNVTIRPLTLRDARQTHRLFVDALSHHFDYLDAGQKQVVRRENRLHSLARATVDRSRVVIVAKQRGRVIGYAIGAVPKDGHGQFYWLFVDPAAREKGIGLRLVSRMLEQMRKRGASDVLLATHDHAKYYARQGFKLVEEVKHGPLTEYIMRSSLENPA